MLTRNSKFILGLAVQVALILLIVIFKLAALEGGTEVALRLAPVDPRDMLRGDYMTIAYDISSVPSSYFAYSPINDGDVVYVPLNKSDKFWSTAYGVSKSMPQVQADYVYIKGAVVNGGREANVFSGDLNRWNNSGTVSVAYNIEQYFVPEGLGNTWVMPRCNNLSGSGCVRPSDTYAVVMVGDDGEAVLKTLILNGKPWPK